MTSLASGIPYPRITTLDGQILLFDRRPFSREGRSVCCSDPQGSWLFTENQVLREYLGATVFHHMGIRIPKFKMGILEERALAEKKIVFVQWLPAGAPLALKTAEKVRLFCAGQLVGAGFFRSHEEPFKTDYNSVFSQLNSGQFFITQSMIGLIDELKQNEDRQWGRTVDAFIGDLSPKIVADALSIAYQELKSATQDLPRSVTRVLDLDQLSLQSIPTIDALREFLLIEWNAVKSAHAYQLINHASNERDETEKEESLESADCVSIDVTPQDATDS